MNTQNWIQRAGIALCAAFAIAGVSAQGLPPEAKPVKSPQPVENDGKIEVLEFFAYGCIHCAQFEPSLAAWVKKQPEDVKFKRVPATFASRGIDTAPIYYTLEAMGVIEKLHQKLFDAANLENVMLGHPATLNKWLEKQGVDPRKYEETQKSFSVVTKINRSRKINSDYNIEVTPSMAINGRHLLTGGGEQVLVNVDQVIAYSRAMNKVSAAPTVSATPAAPVKAKPVVAPVKVAAPDAAPAKGK